MGVKIPFAIKDNKIIHIDQIPLDEKGLACNCTCIDCGEQLIARIAGTKREKHFAHKMDVECYGGGETAIHLFAKQIFSEYKQLCLPELGVEYDEQATNEGSFRYCNSLDDIKERQESYKDFYETNLKVEEICKSQLMQFDEVQTEKKISEIIPDIILYRNGTELLVEIKVTHGIDDEKFKKIKKLNISTIEIDVSEYKESFNKMTYEELRKIFINDTSNKKWIYNKKAKEFIYNQKEKNKQAINEKERK